MSHLLYCVQKFSDFDVGWMAVFDNGCKGAGPLVPCSISLDYKSGYLIRMKNPFPSLPIVMSDMIPSPLSEHASLNNIHREPTTPYLNATENATLNFHRGAMGQTTVITTRAPKQATERMGKHQNMGRERAAISDLESPHPNTTENASLNIHRGAIDQTTVITTQSPKQVMERMGKHLQNMGMHVTRKGSFLYRCLYRGSASSKESSAVDVGLLFSKSLGSFDFLRKKICLSIRSKLLGAAYRGFLYGRSCRRRALYCRTDTVRRIERHL